MQAVRKIVFSLHLYTALIVGLFIVILGVTGSIMAFEDDLDRALNAGLFHVEPGVRKLPIGMLEDRIAGAYPNGRIVFFHFSSRAADSDYASVRLGRRTGAQIFIDPYTGRIIGRRTLPTPFTLIHSFHADLMMGPSGQVFVAVVGALLVWLVCSGFYLWWPRKRAKIKLGAPALRVMFDLHNTLGIYSALFLLAAGLTGVGIFLGGALTVLGGKSAARPLPTGMAMTRPVAETGRPISPDDAVRAAAKALPGATPFEIGMPPNPAKPYTIAMRFPEDLTRGGLSAVLVDPFTGKPQLVQSSRKVAPGTALERLNRAIHTGDILGYPTKILMSLSSFLLIFQAFSGYFVWWKKRGAAQQRQASLREASAD